MALSPGPADGAGPTVSPGEVDAHTHLYSGLAPLGMPAPAETPRDFLEILERVWWRLDRALDERALRAAARLYIAEALLAGTTTLFDHHESPAFIEGSLDVLAQEADSLGCRLVTCFGATERNGGLAEARRGLAECARFVRANRSPLARGLVGLHASFTVSDDAVREAGALARELGVPVHVHVAEDAADVRDARQRRYAGPLQRLLSLGALPPGSILAHGVHLDEAEVAAADEAGLWLVHNPRSNAGNRVGFARTLGRSAHVALGTDGYPADMRAEQLAVEREARAAGCPVEPSAAAARADAGRHLAVARFGPEAVARDAVTWVDGRPERVVVDDQVVVKDGRLVRASVDEIRAHAREEAPRLWDRMTRGVFG